jgi:hypothetical protein
VNEIWTQSMLRKRTVTTGQLLRVPMNNMDFTHSLLESLSSNTWTIIWTPLVNEDTHPLEPVHSEYYGAPPSSLLVLARTAISNTQGNYSQHHEPSTNLPCHVPPAATSTPPLHRGVSQLVDVPRLLVVRV